MVVLATFAATPGCAQTRVAAAPADNTAPATAPAPRIQFVESEFDAGTVTAGTIVRHAFPYINTGTAPLAITDAASSCECTTIQRSPSRVDAGQTGTIVIQFDSSGFNGDIAEAVAVASNDPNHPRTILTLKARVSGPIDLSPAAVLFTRVAGALAPETKRIHITNRTTKPLRLSSPEAGDRAFTAELKTLRPGKEFELSVTAVPPFGSGTFRGSITMKTNLPEVPAIRVPAVVVVQPPVTVAPAAIRWRDGPSTSAREVRVLVRNNSAMSGFAISEATVTLPGVVAVVKEIEAGRRFSVVLTFPVGFEWPHEDHAALKIKTTNPLMPVITVPIGRDPRRT